MLPRRKHAGLFRSLLLFSQICFVEELTSVNVGNAVFLKVSKSVRSQAAVYFVPPGLECDGFLQWKIRHLHFYQPNEKVEFAFLCILLRILSFF